MILLLNRTHSTMKKRKKIQNAKIHKIYYTYIHTHIHTRSASDKRSFQVVYSTLIN